MVWGHGYVVAVRRPEEHQPVSRIHRCGRPNVSTATVLTLNWLAASKRNQFGLVLSDRIHFKSPYHLTSARIQRLKASAISVHFDSVTKENEAIKHRGRGENPGPVVRVRLAVLFLGIAANRPFP